MRYETAIVNEVRPDRTKISKIIIKVYENYENPEDYGQIPSDVFTDDVYMDVRQFYEEAEEADFSQEFLADRSEDGEIFGWDLTDRWQQIGTGYIFLFTLWELCEARKEQTAIIDSNGKICGNLSYSVRLRLTSDKEGKEEVDINLYENVEEAEGKYLQITLKIRAAEIHQEKLRYKSVCSYEWFDGDEEDEIYDTVEVKDEESVADPIYNYQETHSVLITEEICNYLSANFLGVNVYGKSKSKRKKEEKKDKEKKEYLYEYEVPQKEQKEPTKEKRRQSVLKK